MKFFVPYLKFLWREVYGSFEEIKEAGFDGVEIHLIGSMRSPDALAHAVLCAKELGLLVRFHQGWSWETGQRNLLNVLLRALGALVPVGQSLPDQVKYAMTLGGPVVVYGNHLEARNELNPRDYVFQTASEHVGGHEYVMPFREFESRLAQVSSVIALDTQHLLEWMYDLETVMGLPREVLMTARFREFWSLFHSRVVELHWNDADPSLGPNWGRNVVPGRGLIPLRAMAKVVLKSGWDGIVVAELNPKYLGSKSGQVTLEKLNNRVRQYFSE